MRQIRSASSLQAVSTFVCCSLLAAPALAQSWTQIAPVVTPAARAGAALAYDPAQKQLVLFGGRATDYSDETWTLEGDVWTRRSPAHSPVARADAYAFWDSARSRVVMFGGNAAGQIDRATFWTWDGSDWSSSTPASNPPPRRDAAVAYDSTRDRVVLFGGVVDGSPDVTLADTWEFDGNSWLQTTPAASPGDRGAALMGYDPVRKTMLLVNGQSETQRLRWDTWAYDGSSWREILNANAPRGSSLKMIWDPTQQKLLIAGRKETGKLTAWYFDGATWNEQPNASYNLNGIDEASLAFDAERGYVLYLRQENQTYAGFRLRAGTWDQVLPVLQPGGVLVDRGALIFDSEAGEARLLAERSSGDGLQGFRWDGIMWRAMDLGGSARPSASARVAYDTERGVAVAYDYRIFELEDSTWKLRASSSMPAGSGALAYDAKRGRSVYFGGVIAFGQYADSTWSWDGAAWEQLDVLMSPTPRSRAGLSYDERRGRLVLFGGAEIVSGRQRHVFDTWELNGSTWTQVEAEGPTNLRDMPSLTYDQGRQRVVMWARQDPRESKLWEYDGRRWIGTDGPPIEGSAGIVGYDVAAKRLLLHDENGRTWARPSGDAPPENPETSDEADAGAGGGGADESEPRREGGGSGCALTAPASDASSVWALLAALALLRWRPRSR